MRFSTEVSELEDKEQTMEYEEIKLLKQSEKSIVHLVRERDGERIFIRKILKGRHPIYQILQDCQHPCLPKLYDVVIGDDSTTVVEEYIEGQLSGAVELSETEFRNVVRQLCSVLEFLHGKGIIHRDIKPSNIILTEGGGVYLIDFDAARMPKEDLEQDTKLLGTRGFAPPEQYGFAQTDERADIYALGVTLSQFLGEKAQRPHYKRVIRKCMNLDPEKRYQSVRQVRRAFFHTGRNIRCGFAALLLLVLLGYCAVRLPAWQEERIGNRSENSGLVVLPAPKNPHWDGETGMAVWENVPESGEGDEVQFHCRLYRRDAEIPPGPDDSDWECEDKIRAGGSYAGEDILNWNFATMLERNGFYYFAISALGDGIHYADSPYVISDAFEYTGESAQPLPAPTGLEWRIVETDDTRQYYAVWDNLDDYEDEDWFNVTVYDQTGSYVMNNTWKKSSIVEHGYGGILIRAQLLTSRSECSYRFTVQVYSSRPNEYQSSPMPDPPPEEYYSPWLIFNPSGEK